MVQDALLKLVAQTLFIKSVVLGHQDVGGRVHVFQLPIVLISLLREYV